MGLSQITAVKGWGVVGIFVLSLLIVVAAAVLNAPGVVKNACAQQGGQCVAQSKVELSILQKVSTGLCAYPGECSAWSVGEDSRVVKCKPGTFMVGHDQVSGGDNKVRCCKLKFKKC